MYDFFIKCTGGKVYKYRYFDKKRYSIASLKTGTLHCSPPSAFNDPYDCKIGLDIQSLLIAKSGLEEELVSQLFQDFLSVYTGQTSIDNYTPAEQAAIMYWLESDAIKALLANADSFHTEQDLVKNIFSNPDIIIDILRGAISDSEFSNALEMSRQSVASMMANIAHHGTDQLSENMSFSDVVKLSGYSADVDEIALTATLSDKFNPEKHENVLKMQATYERLEKILKEKIEEKFLIGCLADDYKNRLMWAHYADCHKGFCIEYDYNDTDHLDIVPFPVAYISNRIKMPWKALLENTTENMTTATKTMMRALLSKDGAWSYESEWRILIHKTRDANLKMPRISCIYIGALCKEKDRKKLIRIANKLDIPIKQMIIDRGEYTLHAVDVK